MLAVSDRLVDANVPPPAALEWSCVALVKSPIVGSVNVLLVRVSVVALPSNVPLVTFQMYLRLKPI